MIEFCALDFTHEYSNPDDEESYQVFIEYYGTNEGVLTPNISLRLKSYAINKIVWIVSFQSSDIAMKTEAVILSISQ